MNLIKYILVSQLKAASLIAPSIIICFSIIKAKSIKEICIIYISLLGVVGYSWLTSEDRLYVYGQLSVFLISLVLILIVYHKVKKEKRKELFYEKKNKNN